MADKPANKLDWGDTNTTEPISAKQAAGMNENEVFPRDWFNFILNYMSKAFFYTFGGNRWNIIIDSDSDERDYATLAAYIADSPTAGDRVLVKIDETISSLMVIPDDITLKVIDGKAIKTSTNSVAVMLAIGPRVQIEGILRVETSHTGTGGSAMGTAISIDDEVSGEIHLINTTTGEITTGFDFNGDHSNIDILIDNQSSGEITTAVLISISQVGNVALGTVVNDGGGAITNVLTDSSANDSNNVQVQDDTQTYRSGGAKTFDSININLPSTAVNDMFIVTDTNGAVARIPGPPTNLNKNGLGLFWAGEDIPEWVDKGDDIMKVFRVEHSGTITAEGTTNGRLIDTDSNFTTLGITTSHLVVVAGDSESIIWQIDSVVDANTLQLRRSSHSLSTDTIHKNLVYSIHEPFQGKEEWRELGDFDTKVAGDVTDINTTNRILLVECDVTATSQGVNDDLIFSYGDDHSDAVYADGPDISPGNRVFMYLLKNRVLLASADNLTIKKGSASITAQCKIYELKETPWHTEQLIRETGANAP